MAAKVPRERRLGVIAFTRNNFGELISPNAFPQLIYERLILRLSGIHNKAGTVQGTLVTENPFTLIKGVQVSIAGTDFIDVPFTDLRVLTHFIGRRPGGNPPFQASTTGFTNDNFFAEVHLPFALEDMIAPRRGFFAANRYATAKIRIQWGSEADMVTGGTYSTNAIDPSTQVEVWGREWSYETAFESARNLLLHKRSQKITSISSQALTNFEIEIPRDPSLLRGVLIKQYTDIPETPITTLMNAEQQVMLRYNKVDRKFEQTWNELVRLNTETYRAALPTGYAFIDLAPDGDFATLQDTSGLFVTDLVVNTSSVANALLRTTMVRYAPSN